MERGLGMIAVNAKRRVLQRSQLVTLVGLVVPERPMSLRHTRGLADKI